MAAHPTLLYRHTGPVLIRATTDPGGLALPEDLNLFGDDNGAMESTGAWLAHLWQRDVVREAIHLASPVLSGQVDQVLAGRTSDSRAVRRIGVSVASYLLRWQGRATPFGLFAGTALVSVGDQAVARWGTDHHVVARADAQWLGSLIDRLDQCPSVLHRLSVVTNNAVVVRGDRVVIPGLPRDVRLGRFAALEVSADLTRAVRAALAAAREPVVFGDLVTVLCGEFPAAEPHQVSTLLAELVSQGFLVTGLRAPMTVPDALGHVRSALKAVDADEVPEVAALATELRAIHEDLSRLVPAVHFNVARTSRALVAERMRAVCDTGSHPLVLTVGLDGEITVPEPVIREAEAAASALLRLTPHPFGFRRWTDYHARFRAKYGPGDVVPVLDLLADSGLGLPTGYLGAPPGPTGRTLTERDENLLTLIQHAMMDGREDIVLTEPMIRALTAGDPTEMLPPPRAELACQILAPSAEAVTRGQFRLLVTSAPRPGASMAGRFADLMPDTEHSHLADAYATGDTDAIAAQLSFPPRQRHSENVVRTPQLLPQVISLSEHRDPHGDLIGLHDLAVTADSRFLYLVQLSTGQRIQPRVPHALEAGLQTPPLARFLAEVSIGRCAVYGAFDWGAAARLPYLPRLSYGKTVLTPARWLLNTADLTTTDLTAPATTLPEWEIALDTWRQRRRVPAAVVMVENELRLPLDLDQHAHRALLRARLNRADQVELRQAPDPTELAWIGRPHELLIPLRRTTSSPAAHQPPIRLLGHSTQRDAGHLPGRSVWLHARIPGHPDRQDEILTEHLPRLWDGWDDPPLWWFRRHRELTRPDLDQHLSLHLRLSCPEAYGPAARRVGDWAAGLRARNLVPHLEFATYHAETGRYGHDEAMAAAHEVFAADSAAALTQITLATRTGIPVEAVTAAGLVNLATSYTETTGHGLRWLIEQLPQQRGKQDRSLRETTLRLADPHDDWATLRAQPGGQDMPTAWQLRRAALITYREHLARQRDPLSVLRSLLHLHHVRTIGVDPDRERISNRLARAIALRQSALDRQEQR